jgi:hypothetical protein
MNRGDFEISHQRSHRFAAVFCILHYCIVQQELYAIVIIPWQRGRETNNAAAYCMLVKWSFQLTCVAECGSISIYSIQTDGALVHDIMHVVSMCSVVI